jgi:hypothetical protein
VTNTPMSLIDRATLREILCITCSILRNNFFYNEDHLKEFLVNFTGDFSTALTDFGDTAERYVINTLRASRSTRFCFTCLFSSRVIREILIQDFNFNEMELQAFENVISKYSQEKSCSGYKY